MHLKKSIKKIIKLSFLILVKETYLLIKNLLGLVYHPFLTLRLIRLNRDFSQMLLILGTGVLPTLITIGLTTIIFLLNYAGHPYLWLNFKTIILLGNALSLIIVFGFIAYLFFWTYQVIKKNHSRFLIS